MNGSCILFLLISFLSFQSDAASNGKASAPQSNPQYEAHRQAAIQINDLAGRIHSEADGREFADAVANMFEGKLPSVWATQTNRSRIASAEYEAMTDPARLVPEQRIADVWNHYVREIGASEEALVTTAEIHNMRDADYTVGQMLWARGNQTMWTMPNIYAVGSDGKVAGGCRAIEALRVIYDMENLFDNVRVARERLRQGTIVSDLIEKSGKSQGKWTADKSRIQLQRTANPIQPAESRYLKEQGKYAFAQLLERLFDELFPLQPPARLGAGDASIHRRGDSGLEDAGNGFRLSPARGF